MNVAFLFKKTQIVFLLLLCFVVSFNYAEAHRTIRVRKVKNHVSPRHITLSVGSGNGIYAGKYAYGRPLPSYSTKGKTEINRRYYSVNHGPVRRRSLARNYASGYRNWIPNANLQGGRNSPRIDRLGPSKSRKGPYRYMKEPSFKPKRRERPHRVNSMQKPHPPKISNEFEDDYFFPEEAKRAESKYEYESRYPRPKKKRRPEPEDDFKPEFPKIPYYDEKPVSYKPKGREPAYSYSTFIQHPSAPSEESDDIYEDPESFYPVVRNKKKRVKKKSNRKKNKDRYKPVVFEPDQSDETYTPYTSPDQFEFPTKTYKKRNKPSYDSEEEDFTPHNTPSHYNKPKPQVNAIFNTDSDYRGTQNTQQTAQFNPSYSQTWSNLVETTAQPIQYQTESGFQAYYPNQYNNNNYNKDYTSLQKLKPVTNTLQSAYYSQPDTSYKNVAFTNNNNNNNNYNYVNTKLTNSQPQTPTHYNPYNTVYSSPTTYSQPITSSSTTLNDVTIQKSVPVYDNTETFYNFNNNAFVNSQSSKYYNSDPATKYYDPNNTYGTKITFNSYKYKLGQGKFESDSEFIKKHQNLYNNGLSGVPIQGDGYAKESLKKDYDIGYGDFQFDENPTI